MLPVVDIKDCCNHYDKVFYVCHSMKKVGCNPTIRKVIKIQSIINLMNN